jgi:hypothetical protein
MAITDDPRFQEANLAIQLAQQRRQAQNDAYQQSFQNVLSSAKEQPWQARQRDLEARQTLAGDQFGYNYLLQNQGEVFRQNEDHARFQHEDELFDRQLHGRFAEMQLSQLHQEKQALLQGNIQGALAEQQFGHQSALAEMARAGREAEDELLHRHKMDELSFEGKQKVDALKMQLEYQAQLQQDTFTSKGIEDGKLELPKEAQDALAKCDSDAFRVFNSTGMSEDDKNQVLNQIQQRRNQIKRQFARPVDMTGPGRDAVITRQFGPEGAQSLKTIPIGDQGGTLYNVVRPGKDGWDVPPNIKAIAVEQMRAKVQQMNHAQKLDTGQEITEEQFLANKRQDDKDRYKHHDEVLSDLQEQRKREFKEAHDKADKTGVMWFGKSSPTNNMGELVGDSEDNYIRLHAEDDEADAWKAAWDRWPQTQRPTKKQMQPGQPAQQPTQPDQQKMGQGAGGSSSSSQPATASSPGPSSPPQPTQQAAQQQASPVADGQFSAAMEVLNKWRKGELKQDDPQVILARRIRLAYLQQRASKR